MSLSPAHHNSAKTGGFNTLIFYNDKLQCIKKKYFFSKAPFRNYHVSFMCHMIVPEFRCSAINFEVHEILW
ncbi:hypothetical protein B188_22550 [Candidatus Brocadiaceae bacterium B188]|nr:hypothetical protein B188_22550 [Candidatus Brocadiaceae bacterium B188]